MSTRAVDLADKLLAECRVQAAEVHHLTNKVHTLKQSTESASETIAVRNSTISDLQRDLNKVKDQRNEAVDHRNKLILEADKGTKVRHFFSIGVLNGHIVYKEYERGSAFPRPDDAKVGTTVLEHD